MFFDLNFNKSTRVILFLCQDTVENSNHSVTRVDDFCGSTEDIGIETTRQAFLFITWLYHSFFDRISNTVSIFPFCLPGLHVPQIWFVRRGMVCPAPAFRNLFAFCI